MGLPESLPRAGFANQSGILCGSAASPGSPPHRLPLHALFVMDQVMDQSGTYSVRWTKSVPSSHAGAGRLEPLACGSLSLGIDPICFRVASGVFGGCLPCPDRLWGCHGPVCSASLCHSAVQGFTSALTPPHPSIGRFLFVVVFVRGRFGGAQRPPKGIVSACELVCPVRGTLFRSLLLSFQHLLANYILLLSCFFL